MKKRLRIYCYLPCSFCQFLVSLSFCLADPDDADENEGMYEEASADFLLGTRCLMVERGIYGQT